MTPNEHEPNEHEPNEQDRVEFEVEIQAGVGVTDEFQRIWMPERMAYIKGEGKSDDSCVFCDLPKLPDEDALIVARGDLVYVVLMGRHAR